MLQRSSRTGSRRSVRLAVETLEDRATPSVMAADGLLNTAAQVIWPPDGSAPALVLTAGGRIGGVLPAANRGAVDGDIILLGTRKVGEEVPAGLCGSPIGSVLSADIARSGDVIPQVPTR